MMSERETIPTSFPSATTGIWLIPWSTMRVAAFEMSSSGAHAPDATGHHVLSRRPERPVKLFFKTARAGQIDPRVQDLEERRKVNVGVLHHDIALGHHSNDLPTRVDDRDALNLVIEQSTRDLGDRRVRPDADHRPRHQS